MAVSGEGAIRARPTAAAGSAGGAGRARPAGRAAGAGGTSFEASLAAERLRWSRHARERLATRGMTLSPAEVERVAQGVERAAAKGSRESLVLVDELALIVNVRNRTVLTALDRRRLQEGVVTNIDSTVFA